MDKGTDTLQETTTLSSTHLDDKTRDWRLAAHDGYQLLDERIEASGEITLSCHISSNARLQGNPKPCSTCECRRQTFQSGMTDPAHI